MMMKQSFKIGVAAGLLIVATAACGVKSTPDFPEGATYPRVYPALKDQAKGTVGEAPAATTRTGAYGSTYTRQTRRNAGDVYTPPPPATELLVK